MHFQFAFALKRLFLLFTLFAIGMMPAIAFGQPATPEASPEPPDDPGCRIAAFSIQVFNPAEPGGETLELFHTEVEIDTGGGVLDSSPHYGTLSVTAMSGSVCYAVLEAPAETISILLPGRNTVGDTDESAAVGCGPAEPACDFLCLIAPGTQVLLRAGDTLTHVIPSVVGPDDPPGLVHMYVNAGDSPAMVVLIEHGPPSVLRSCHGGCA